MIATIKAAEAIAGTLGNPSKMPGKSYGLPAAKASWVPTYCETMGLPVPLTYGCAVGAKLVNVAGSTCSHCYADDKANYSYSSVKKSQVTRLVGVWNPQWIDAMVYLIEKRLDAMFAATLADHLNDWFADAGHMPTARDMVAIEADAWETVRYFRWHDSGDILGAWHLELIAEVCRRTPWVRHWLPTREVSALAQYKRDHSIPSNLTIRVSATKVDGAATKAHPTTSTVHATAPAIGDTCPAPLQDNACGPCRRCWDNMVANVSYHIH